MPCASHIEGFILVCEKFTKYIHLYVKNCFLTLSLLAWPKLTPWLLFLLSNMYMLWKTTIIYCVYSTYIFPFWLLFYFTVYIQVVQSGAKNLELAVMKRNEPLKVEHIITVLKTVLWFVVEALITWRQAGPLAGKITKQASLLNNVNLLTMITKEKNSITSTVKPFPEQNCRRAEYRSPWRK